eukprot:GHVN01064899.1.p2 GENE.GHVN01064899.1~~GHVN01064899.1.p2  ORF type:complete len:208 (-),score=35.10 GHVN01064899.1:1108-1731(-)
MTREDTEEVVARLRRGWLFGVDGSNDTDPSSRDGGGGVCETRPPSKFIQGIIEFEDPNAYMALKCVTDCVTEALSELEENFDFCQAKHGIVEQVEACLAKQRARDSERSSVDEVVATQTKIDCLVAGLEEKLSCEEEHRVLSGVVRSLKSAETAQMAALSRAKEAERMVDELVSETMNELEKCTLIEQDGVDGAHQIFSHLVPHHRG